MSGPATLELGSPDWGISPDSLLPPGIAGALGMEFPSLTSPDHDLARYVPPQPDQVLLPPEPQASISAGTPEVIKKTLTIEAATPTQWDPGYYLSHTPASYQSVGEDGKQAIVLDASAYAASLWNLRQEQIAEREKRLAEMTPGQQLLALGLPIAAAATGLLRRYDRFIDAHVNLPSQKAEQLVRWALKAPPRVAVLGLAVACVPLPHPTPTSPEATPLPSPTPENLAVATKESPQAVVLFNPTPAPVGGVDKAFLETATNKRAQAYRTQILEAAQNLGVRLNALDNEEILNGAGWWEMAKVEPHPNPQVKPKLPLGSEVLITPQGTVIPLENPSPSYLSWDFDANGKVVLRDQPGNEFGRVIDSKPQLSALATVVSERGLIINPEVSFAQGQPLLVEKVVKDSAGNIIEITIRLSPGKTTTLKGEDIKKVELNNPALLAAEIATPVPSPTPDIKGVAQAHLQELAQAQNLSLKDLKIVVSESPDKRSATAFLQSLSDPSLGWLEKGGKLVEIKAPTGASSLIWDFASPPLRGGALAALGPDGKPYIWLGPDNTDPTRTCWIDKDGKNYGKVSDAFLAILKERRRLNPAGFFSPSVRYFTKDQPAYFDNVIIVGFYPDSKTTTIALEGTREQTTISYGSARLGVNYYTDTTMNDWRYGTADNLLQINDRGQIYIDKDGNVLGMWIAKKKP